MTIVVCGIDVSTDRLDVHVGGEDRQFNNNRP